MALREFIGKFEGNLKGMPQKSAQRCMSSKVYFFFASLQVDSGTSTWPMERNRPPSSIGRHTRVAPCLAATASAWVLPRYAKGEEKSQ